MSGDENAAQILAYLNEHHYFTERHSVSQPFYQYHPLFREFLVASLKREASEQAVQQLQQQGAALLEESGDVEAAIELYLSAQCWQDAGRVICGAAQTMISQGRGESVVQWLRRIPDTVMESSGWLLFWDGMACLSSSPLKAREKLQRAYDNFRQAGDLAGTAMALAGAIDTFTFGWHNFHPLDYWIDELSDLLSKHEAFPTPEIEARLAVAMFSALMYRRPQAADFKLWAQRALDVARNTPEPEYRLVIGLHLGTYYVSWGRHREMESLQDELRPVVDSADVAPVARIMFRAIEAMYCTRALRDGMHAAREAQELADQTGVYVLNSLLWGFATLLSINNGDLDDAAKYLASLAATLHASRPLDQGLYHWLHGHLAYVQDDIPAAFGHAQQAAENTRVSGSVFHENMTRICLARMLVETREYREAHGLVQEILPAIRQMHNRALECDCLLVQAQCAFAEKRETDGLEYLASALHTMARINVLTAVWWRSDRMQPLLEKALKFGIETDHVRRIITANKMTPAETSGTLEHWPWAVKIRTLGGFRLERDGQPLVFKGKPQKKALELLKAIVAFGGDRVNPTRLAEALWPDAEADAALQSLKTTLYRLRKLLGKEEAVEVFDGNISLNRQHCWSDAQAFERLTTAHQSTGDDVDHEAVIALYSGPFLGTDDNFTWAAICRERLHHRFVNHMVAVGEKLEQQDEWNKALRLYEHGLDVDSLIESFYQGVMRCCEALGRHADGIAAFKRCTRTIETHFGVPVSQTTIRIAERLGCTP